MTPEQYQSYRKTVAQGPYINVSDLDTGDHTLTLGYEIERDDIHVYVIDDEIHVVTYRGSRLIEHESGTRMSAHLLRPSKRAFPDATNETFAHLMRNADAELCFLGNFDWNSASARERADKDLKAPTHRDF